MENWGLITFSEDTLLLNSKATMTEKQNVQTTIAHEIAHHWVY